MKIKSVHLQAFKRFTDLKIVGLDRSATEVSDLRQRGITVLNVRHMESHLYSDEILRKLCETNGQSDKSGAAIELKMAALSESVVSRGNPPDDMKSASGTLYVQLKRMLGLTQCGNTSEAFCVDTLSPLITPDTSTYLELVNNIMSGPQIPESSKVK